MKLCLLLLLTCAAHAARADESALRQCRALTDAAARLACYDALPLAPLAAAPQPPLVLPAAPAAPAVPAVPAAAAPAAPAASVMASTFGLARSDEKLQDITSTIPGLFEGWRAGSRIRLANGQLWQISDDSSALYWLRDPKVTVRRAALGGFVLDVEGANRMPRVRRLE
jgi:hypothetical protein